jgi:hypothetical protein
MGYSLWLIPPKDSTIEHSLQSAIQSLGCSFAPHVTLISKIPLSTPIEEIRSSLISYLTTHDLPDVRIVSLETGSEFFKRIFLRCEQTSSLVALARFSRETFLSSDVDDNINQWVDQYDPHVSLVYAEKTACDDEQLISRLNLPALIHQQWQGGQLCLIDTSEALSQWKTVLQFDLPKAA